jgi:hypothetical protein
MLATPEIIELSIRGIIIIFRAVRKISPIHETYLIPSGKKYPNGIARNNAIRICQCSLILDKFTTGFF